MSKSLSVEQKVASHRFHRGRVTTYISPSLHNHCWFRLSCDYNTCHPQHEPLLLSGRNVRHALPLNSWCTRSNQINRAAIKTLLLLFVVTGSYHPKGSSSSLVIDWVSLPSALYLLGSHLVVVKRRQTPLECVSRNTVIEHHSLALLFPNQFNGHLSRY